jgi:hypothetical protein
MSGVHCFTSCTAGYLPKARVLASTLKQRHRDCTFHLVLAEAGTEALGTDEPFDVVHTPSRFAIPCFKSWAFMHDVVEFCTGIKGAALVHLLDDVRADKVLYFDPDVVVLGGLQSLVDLLDRHSILLTPHLTDPESCEEAVRDNELAALKHGTFNLGFLGVRRDNEGCRFARWWCDRLMRYCRRNGEEGLFVDQRWANLVPGMFDGVHVVRDRRYNVATWNLNRRPVRFSPSGEICVEEGPVVFYHFSGYDSGAGRLALKKYAPPDSPLFELWDWYEAELRRRGPADGTAFEWSYGRLEDGSSIPHRMRVDYRNRPDWQADYVDPFLVQSAGGAAFVRQWRREQQAVRRALGRFGRWLVRRITPPRRFRNALRRFWNTLRMKSGD